MMGFYKSYSIKSVTQYRWSDSFGIKIAGHSLVSSESEDQTLFQNDIQNMLVYDPVFTEQYRFQAPL